MRNDHPLGLPVTLASGAVIGHGEKCSPDPESPEDAALVDARILVDEDEPATAGDPSDEATDPDTTAAPAEKPTPPARSRRRTTSARSGAKES